MNIDLMQEGCARLIDETHVEMWHVRGDHSINFFPSKMAAEIAARIWYPNEGEVERYGRIYFRRFYTLDALG